MSFVRPRLGRRLRSITARLTLWGAAITFTISVLLCGVLYTGANYSLQTEIDTFLEGEVHEFLVAVNARGSDIDALERDVRRELGARGRSDLAFRLFDERGELVLSSMSDDPVAANWKAAPGSIPGLGRPRFETLRPPLAADSFRLCSASVELADGRPRIVQASYRLDRMVASLGIFRGICLGALGAVVASSLLAGYFLARRSLSPIRRLTVAARGISPDTLDHRVPITGTGDELDRLSETLNAMLERVERHVRRLRQFTADASHELRTPLTALRGATEVALSKERSAEQLRATLEENLVQFERLQRIAEQLLLLARLDAGETVLRTQTVALDRIVAETVELYRPFAEERGLILRCDCAEGVAVSADADRLRQVLANLLDNAMKFTPSPGEVGVSLDADGDRARLIVRDTGMGIPVEALPRVFDRFYRVDAARSSRGDGGFGLGLAICKSIAEAHGGSMEIESALGAGTTVQLVLPLADPPGRNGWTVPGRTGLVSRPSLRGGTEPEHREPSKHRAPAR